MKSKKREHSQRPVELCPIAPTSELVAMIPCSVPADNFN